MFACWSGSSSGERRFDEREREREKVSVVMMADYEEGDHFHLDFRASSIFVGVNYSDVA